MKKILLALIATIFVSGLFAQQKQKLSVLYVGYSPEKELPTYNRRKMSYESEEHFKQEFTKRMPSFVNLLNKYFSKVGSIDARDYKESDSDKYDVTIFDEATTPIAKAIRGKDPETGKFRYVPAKFLSEDFDRPAIFIGIVADIMTRSLGSKLDDR